jgi:hypothetical protein
MSTMTIAPLHADRLDHGAPAPVRLRVVRPDETAVKTAVRSQVRLTRRGRLAIFLASLVAVLCVGVALGAGSSATQEPGTPAPTRTVVVGPGDTLWGIAGGLAGDGEVRAMVDRIERLNALDTALVQSGQRLRVPLTE